jgi:hypothetical protein
MQLPKRKFPIHSKTIGILLLLVLLIQLNLYSQNVYKGKFSISVAYFDRLISEKTTGDEFYKILENSIESWEDKTYMEFNEATCEHNNQIYKPECRIEYNGSSIYISFICDSNSTKPISSITIGFNCGCSWLNIKSEAQNNGYKLTEYTDRPDKLYKGVFGGLQIKFSKAEKEIFYHKYHSKTYFEFSISKRKKKELSPKTAIEFLESAKSKLKCNDNRAWEYVNKAIELNPNYTDAILFRALLRYNTIRGNKEFTEGSQTWVTMQDINKTIQLDSNNISAYFLRAQLYGLLEKYSEAIEDLSKVLSFDNNFFDAYTYRALYKSQQKDTKGAIEDLNQILVRNPKHIEALSERAILFYEIKDYDNACKDFNLAKQFGLSTSGRLDFFNLIQKCR